LTCPPGAKVSLEHLDDVAIHYTDGSVALEQVKSALKRNPLTDSAEDLWNTIANWLHEISSGKYVLGKTTFGIYVAPPKMPGNLATRMNDAASPADVAAIVNIIKTKHITLKKAKGCGSFVQTFLQAPEDLRNAVIQSFTLVSKDSDPVDPLRQLIKTAVAPEIVDMLCEAAIGMAKEQADRLLRIKQLALIDGDAFKIKFRSFICRINIPGLLSSFTPPPPESDVESILLARPIFIRQLEIIKVANDHRIRAVSDYLRSSADKSLWAERGEIFEDSLLGWDNELIRRHRLISEEVAEVHEDKEAAVRGRMVYRQCAQLQLPLEGRTVPDHFVHGSFNALADGMRVGWHPNYRALLLIEDANESGSQ
jgi:hypothetical protein